MIFFANKIKDKLVFESDRFDEYVKCLPNCRVVVNIKRYRKPLSDKQRGLFHALCNYIAEYSGHTIEAIKNGIKVECGLYKPDDLGQIVMISTESLNTKEYNVLIESAYQRGSMLGLILPTPEEYYNQQ